LQQAIADKEQIVSVSETRRVVKRGEREDTLTT